MMYRYIVSKLTLYMKELLTSLHDNWMRSIDIKDVPNTARVPVTSKNPKTRVIQTDA